MPIRDENRDRYPADWKQISARVREEAGNVCEFCTVPNGAMIYRGTHDGKPAWRLRGSPVFCGSHDADTGAEMLGTSWDDFDTNCRAVTVVLTVAHLDHMPEHNARENLRALCQRCHNAYDAPMRRAGMRDRAKASRAAADLFDGDT